VSLIGLSIDSWNKRRENLIDVFLQSINSIHGNKLINSRNSSNSTNPSNSMNSSTTAPQYGRELVPTAKHLSVDRRALGMGLLIASTFIFCYARALVPLVSQWWSNNIYSYGFLIPGISGCFVWILRKELFQFPLVPNYPWGLSIFLLGLLLLLAGQVGGVMVIQWVSLIISLTGLVLFLMGNHFLRKLWFPIAYLLFMIPFWEIVTDRLHFPFQNVSAIIGATLLKLINIPVYQNGVYLQLPNITLQIARVCSGVSYLLAVVAISLPTAIFFLEGWFRRILLICFAVIVAILSNGLRVGLIGLLSYHGIGGDIHGPFHILQGLFVSGVGYVAIFFGLWILSKRSSASSNRFNRSGAAKYISSKISGSKNLLFPTVCVVVLLMLVGGYIHFHTPSRIPLKMSFSLFPPQIGEWNGKEIRSSFTNYREVGVDQELSRIYETSSGDSVRIYVGYFEYQKQTKELISYLTTEIHNHATKIKVDMNPRGYVEINKVIQRDGKKNTLTLFWYDFNGRVVTDVYTAKFYTVWDAFTRGRTNGAVIILTADFIDKEDLPGTLMKVEGFVGSIYPFFRNYLPSY
jgi:EpsI family protein